MNFFYFSLYVDKGSFSLLKVQIQEFSMKPHGR